MKKSFLDYWNEADVDSKVDVATQNFEKTIEAKNQTPEQVVSDFMKALADANAEMSKSQNKRAIINLRVNTKSFMFKIQPNRIEGYEEGKRGPLVIGTLSDIKTKLIDFLKEKIDGQQSS